MLLQQSNSVQSKPTLPVKYNFKFAILIGGVAPQDLVESVNLLRTQHINMLNILFSTPILQGQKISIPSLHIMGKFDEYRRRSELLYHMYDQTNDMRTVMIHEEGHNIPSIRTELYPLISSWIEDNQSAGPDETSTCLDCCHCIIS